MKICPKHGFECFCSYNSDCQPVKRRRRWSDYPIVVGAFVLLVAVTCLLIGLFASAVSDVAAIGRDLGKMAMGR